MKFLTFCIVGAAVAPLFACSPAADPQAKGNASYQVDSKDGCSNTVIAGIGAETARTEGQRPGPPDLPIAGSSDQPSNFGTEVTDGSSTPAGGKYTVECTVRDGEEYDLTVEMKGPNYFTDDAQALGETRIVVTGSVDKETGVGTGRATVTSTKTSAVSPEGSGDVCDIELIKDTEELGSFEIGEGHAKFIFSCESTKSALDDFGVCETRGTVWVRDCEI